MYKWTVWDGLVWRLGFVRRSQYEHVCGQYAEAVDRYMKTLEQLNKAMEEIKVKP
jgi:hypothetical protein